MLNIQTPRHILNIKCWHLEWKCLRSSLMGQGARHPSGTSTVYCLDGTKRNSFVNGSFPPGNQRHPSVSEECYLSAHIHSRQSFRRHATTPSFVSDSFFGCSMNVGVPPGFRRLIPHLVFWSHTVTWKFLGKAPFCCHIFHCT
jgi:hypothetical protein